MYFQLQQMYSCETMSKGACIKRMVVAVRNYSTNTTMEKKQTSGRGAVKDTEFSVNTIRTI